MNVGIFVLCSLAVYASALPAQPSIHQNAAQYKLQLKRIYDGIRAKREAEESAAAAVEVTADKPKLSAARNFGDVAKILAIAGTKPVAVDPSGSYSGRRRRQTGSFRPQPNQASRAEENAAIEQAGPADQSPRGARNFGDISKILAIAGTGPVAVDPSGSYSGRRRRGINTNLHGLVPEVTLHAVKIKSRGKHGNIAHEIAAGATPSSRTVFEAGYNHKRRRRDSDNFIPFSENEERKVKTLKIEQTDFLATKARRPEVQSDSARQKRKFQA